MLTKLFSFIPSFSTIKYYIIAILTGAVIVVYALLSNEKKERAQEKLKGMKKARETEKRINKATVEGIQREAKSKSDRNYDDDDII